MRVCFGVLLRQGLSNTEIGKCLSRSRITVATERKRWAQGAYRAEIAQNEADTKALRPRLGELVADPGLAEQVSDRLGESLSPHVISAELRCYGTQPKSYTINYVTTTNRVYL